MDTEQFWLTDPDIIMTDYKNVLPTRSQTPNQQLNALTRMLILVTLFLIIIRFDLWFIFLLVGLIVIILMALLMFGGQMENYSDFTVVEDSDNEDEEVVVEKPRRRPTVMQKSLDANLGTYSSPRHNGSVGYMSSTERHEYHGTLRDAKRSALDDYQESESTRRERLVRGFSHKRDREFARSTEHTGYSPLNTDLYEQSSPSINEPRRTYNGYVVL